MIPIIPFPHAAIITACNTMRRNNEEAAKRRKQNIDKSILTKKIMPQSEIILKINDESTAIEYNVVNDYDWVRAAWTLINICEQKGQMEQLQKLMSKEMIVKSGEFPD